MPRVNVKDRRRQQLIDANIASIARRGIAETTITHVSQGASMSRGIVNFYFDAKEAMMKDTLRALMEDYAAHWQKALKDKENAPAREQLDALIGANFDGAACAPRRLAAWAAFAGHAASHKDYAAVIRAAEEQYRGALERIWKKIGADKKQADFPRRLHAMIRGHWLLLTASPGAQEMAQAARLCRQAVEEAASGATPVAAGKKVKPANENKIAKPQPRKKAASDVSQRQLDFADLFGV